MDLLACLAVTVVLVALVTSPPRLAALAWAGRISYGLYLSHLPVFHGVLNSRRMLRLGVAGAPLLVLRFGAGFAVAAVSFYLIELPVLRLKERFRNRPHAPPFLPSAAGAPRVNQASSATNAIDPGRFT